MKLRIKALLSLRWNYKLWESFEWLKGRKHAPVPAWQKRNPVFAERSPCPRCGCKPPRGYQRILSEPEKVIAEQTGLAGLNDDRLNAVVVDGPAEGVMG